MNLTGKQIMKGQRWQETARCLLPFLSFQKHRLHFKQPWAKSKCNAAELCLSPWQGGRGASVKPVLGTFTMNFMCDFIRMQGVLLKWQCGVCVDPSTAWKLNIFLLKASFVVLDAFPPPPPPPPYGYRKDMRGCRLEKSWYHFRVCW